MNTRPTLDIVIVNWNTGPQLGEALRSIAASNQRRLTLSRVVVVDNASTDDSLRWPALPGLPLTLLCNATNRGFAAACNQGAAGSTADYLLFLNPDTCLETDTLDQTGAFMEDPAHARVGVASVALRGATGHLSKTCARFPTPGALWINMLGLPRLLPRRFQTFLMTDWDHADTRRVDHVIGAYYFMRRQLFERLGGFDERFFMYYEDVDLSFRIARDGWEAWFIAETHAFHKGGGSSEHIKATRLFYVLRSQILYAFKHFRRPTAWGLWAGILFVEFWPRLVWTLAGRNTTPRELIEAYRLLWADMPSILRRAFVASHP